MSEKIRQYPPCQHEQWPPLCTWPHPWRMHSCPRSWCQSSLDAALTGTSLRCWEGHRDAIDPPESLLSPGPRKVRLSPQRAPTSSSVRGISSGVNFLDPYCFYHGLVCVYMSKVFRALETLQQNFVRITKWCQIYIVYIHTHASQHGIFCHSWKKLNSDLQTYILLIIIWIKYSSKKTEENKITRNSWTWIFSAKVRWTVTFTQARYKMKSCLNTITRKRFDRYTNIKDQDAKDSYKLWKLAL